jgi:uncharacterized integral membrane protein (TIGR00697 family)
LATDILSENHSKKDAFNAVRVGLFVALVWTVLSQVILLFTPNSEDFAGPSMELLFGMVPRLTIGSIVTYALSQRLDVLLYHYLWKKTGNTKKWLWLRNNAATLTAQLLDTALFTVIAFAGVFEAAVVVELILTTYVLKMAIALLDTPVLYIARRLKNKPPLFDLQSPALPGS